MRRGTMSAVLLGLLLCGVAFGQERDAQTKRKGSLYSQGRRVATPTDAQLDRKASQANARTIGRSIFAAGVLIGGGIVASAVIRSKKKSGFIPPTTLPDP